LTVAWVGLLVAALVKIAGVDRWYELGLEALLVILVVAAITVRVARRGPRDAGVRGSPQSPVLPIAGTVASHSIARSVAAGRPAHADTAAAGSVSEDKPPAEDLRQSEAMLAGIVAACPDAIVAIDAHQRITLLNQSAERIFGYTRAEALGAPLGLLVPSRFRDAHLGDVDHFAHGGAVNRKMGEAGAVFGQRKNGEEFPVDAAISKIDVAGTPVVTVVLRDISEQLQVETEQRFLADLGATLAATLDYEQTLANIARLAVRDLADICIVDVLEEDGRVRREQVMGREPRRQWLCEVLTDAGLERGPSELVQTVLDTRRPIVVSPVTPDIAARLSQDADRQRALRSARLTSVVAVPLLAHATLVGVVTLITCTQSRRAASPAVAEALAQRAALSIANARLLRETQRALKVRDDVLAIVSHDLRSPVATIGLLADLLRQAHPTSRTRLAALAEDIQSSVDDMYLLIDDLLDFARIHSATFSVELHAHGLQGVVTPVVERLRLLAAARHQAIQVDIPGDLPAVDVDVRRVRQVIANLVGNAIKFTGDGGAIRVEARQHDGLVKVSVTDTGIGIPPEYLSRIFDRFWQPPRAQHRGAGLGLSIAKGIVEAHGGVIAAESTPGQGSTFSFTLRVAGGHPQAAEESRVLHGAG
jgi:PAS domain S-box-containing protein